MRWPQGFLDWLREEAHGKDVVFVVLATIVLCFGWSWVALLFIGLFKGMVAMAGQMSVYAPHLHSSFILSGLAFYFGMALYEEIAFRLPLAICVARGWRLERVLLVAVAISVLFGFLHGGIAHIFVQGVAGFAFSVVFLKCGGWHGRWVKALLASSMTHFALNMLVIIWSVLAH